MMRRHLLGASCAVLGLLLPAASQGNGAFPDTAGVLLPRDQPDTIVLGTNFGLVSSTNGGLTWRWACEHDESVQGSAYQLSAAPGMRIFTISAAGLAYTD